MAPNPSHHLRHSTLQRLWDAAQVLPVVWRAKRVLHAQGNIHEQIAKLEQVAKRQPRKPWRATRVVRAVRDALWLLGKRERACLPRSLGVFALLTAMGEEPTIVTGVTRINGKLDGHAWVELHGQPIPGSGDESSPLHFRESFRYPQRT